MGGKTGILVENAGVWQGGPNVRDRRVLARHEDKLYEFGAYYERAEPLEELDTVLMTVRMEE